MSRTMGRWVFVGAAALAVVAGAAAMAPGVATAEAAPSVNPFTGVYVGPGVRGEWRISIAKSGAVKGDGFWYGSGDGTIGQANYWEASLAGEVTTGGELSGRGTDVAVRVLDQGYERIRTRFEFRAHVELDGSGNLVGTITGGTLPHSSSSFTWYRN